MAEEDRETRSSEDATSGDEGRQGEGNNGGDGGGESFAQELKQAVRDAAMEVLGPAAREATSSAAKYAVGKGPELVTKNVMPALEKAGGAGGLAQQVLSKGGEALSGSGGLSGGLGGVAGKVMSKLGGGGGGGEASGWGRNRRMPVQQFIYVSVPVRDAYNGWTEYKQWPRYMHRANQVDAQIDEKQARVKVTEKMWGFKRPFTAEVIEQRPDQRIKWNSTEGSKHTGVINFHELAPRLTLIELNFDLSPSGMMEKIARGTRFVKRAVRADFHRFQGWIEMKSDDELSDLEGWRGTIEGGQIVKSHEDAVEEEQREDEQGEGQQPEGEYDEEPEAAEEEEGSEEGYDEPEADEEEEPEGEYEEPAEEESEYEEGPEAEEDEPPEAEEEEEPEAEEYEQPEAEEEGEAAPRSRQARPRRRQQASGQAGRQAAPTRQQPRRRKRSGTAEEEGSETPPARPQRRRRPARQQGAR